MKKLVLALSLFVTGVTFASFPVNQTENTEKVVSIEETTQNAIELNEATEEATLEEVSSESPATAMDQETLILILLWLVLGGFAAHRWYAGKPVGWNILFILTAGGCGIWAIVDLVKILQGNFK